MGKNVQRCNRCGNVLSEYRMLMATGPKGYRVYPHCLGCARKLGAAKAKIGGRQRAKLRGAG